MGQLCVGVLAVRSQLASATPLFRNLQLEVGSSSWTFSGKADEKALTKIVELAFLMC